MIGRWAAPSGPRSTVAAVDTSPLPARDGRALEGLVADVFARHGYAVERNVRLTGASGARYEVDVMAVRPDPLVPHRVAVECKNTGAPADAQVVARLRMLVGDAALGAGLLVAPAGATPAARAAAQAGGVTVWGADDLARHAGRAALAGLAPARAPVAPGLPRRVDAGDALRAVRVQVRGAWGLGRGAVEGPWAAWLEVHEIEVHHTRPGRRGRREARRTLVYVEAVGGTPIDRTDDPWPTEDVHLDATVLGDAAASDTAAALVDAARRRDRAVQDAARLRHERTLESLGLDPDAEDVHVGAVRSVHLPVWVGVESRRDASRALVVDGVDGRPDPRLSEVVTARLGYVRDRLGATA